MKVGSAAACSRAAALLFTIGSLFAGLGGLRLRADQVRPAPPTQASAGTDLLTPVEERPIRGLNWPALSPDGKTLCFTYLGDLWTVPAAGGVATRMTVHEALDATPHWSPDGKWIAFTSLRTGNPDIFLMPAQGGSARQVTTFAGSDRVTDWSPDGTKLLFYSQRDTQASAIYSMDLKTRAFRRLTNDEEGLEYAAYSPDGKTIAYTRGGMPWWRPWYKGSLAASIVLEEVATGKVHTLYKSNAQQFWPLFTPDGKGIYVTTLLGEDNTPNLWRIPIAGGAPKQITHYKTDAVRSPAIAHNGSLLAYLYQGDIYTARPDGSDAKKVSIIAHSDDKVNNQEHQALTQDATGMELSPDGKQLALVLRNSLWLVPGGGGDAKRLTESDGSYEDIAWSPDSAKLVLISDRGNQVDLYTLDVKTKALTRLTNDAAAESNTTFSPDGKYISFAKAGDHPGLYLIPAAGGEARRVAEGNGTNTGFLGINSYAWSPDSRWIAFSRMDQQETRDIWVVPAVGGTAVNVTRYPGVNFLPKFTRDGRRLLFLSDRNAPKLLYPDDRAAYTLYQIPLEVPDDSPDDGAKKPLPDRRGDVKIDFDEIHLRARFAMPPIGPANDYLPTADGQRVIVHAANNFWLVPLTGGPVLQLTANGEAGVNMQLSPDGSRFFYIGANGTVRSLGLPPQPPQPPTVLNFIAQYTFDRHLQYQQAFNEFYREYGRGFYDPKMHGVDWHALHDKYEPLLQGVGTPEEFAYLLSQMVGEVNASHSEVIPNSKGGGPQMATLGIAFDNDYAGPGLKVAGVLPKGPADKPAARVLPGEYILSVDGTGVALNENYYDAIQDKAGKTVELLVNSKPTKDGARTVKLRPIPPDVWMRLDYEARVRQSREEVDRLSGGRLAYIRIKVMDVPSLSRFERELYSDAINKEGLVLDIRGNIGGNTHESILEDLSRKLLAYQQPRDGIRESSPRRAWSKPIVLLIDQESFSDAEVFPAGFRALHLGKIVGVPTPGYVIGTEEAVLLDGTRFRIPTYGWYTAEGKNLENVGVVPDILVENTPEDLAANRDRQLQAAVEVLLRDLPGHADSTAGK